MSVIWDRPHRDPTAILCDPAITNLDVMSETSSTVLYIIGNGFDLYHKIPSSYCKFRDFVRDQESQVFEVCERHLPADENWSDLEEALGNVDAHDLLSEGDDWIVGYGADDWSDSYHHDFQWAVSETTSALSSKLLKLFCRWITSLDIPDAESVDNLLPLDVNGNYVCFNYTPTLTHTYGISRQRIFFPHGFIQETDTSIVLGHAWIAEDKDKLGSSIDEDTDTRVAEGMIIVDGYFKETFKPSSEIIEAAQGYFSSLRQVNLAIVLGHSMHPVDHPYFEEIIRSINPSAKWQISYYGSDGLENNREQCAKLGVSADNVEHIQLQDLQLPEKNHSSGTLNNRH